MTSGGNIEALEPGTTSLVGENNSIAVREVGSLLEKPQNCHKPFGKELFINMQIFAFKFSTFD